MACASRTSSSIAVGSPISRKIAVQHFAPLQVFPELWSALTEYGRRDFVTELVEAAMSDNPYGKARRVVKAWYQTLIVLSDPDYEENVKLARQMRPSKGETVEQLRRKFGLAREPALRLRASRLTPTRLLPPYRVDGRTSSGAAWSSTSLSTRCRTGC